MKSLTNHVPVHRHPHEQQASADRAVVSGAGDFLAAFPEEDIHEERPRQSLLMATDSDGCDRRLNSWSPASAAGG